MFQLSIWDKPGGRRLADWSARATSWEWDYGRYGSGALRATIRMSRREAFLWYDAAMLHVEVRDHSCDIVWCGRLEDPLIVEEGLEIVALGYWAALSDERYTALWDDRDLRGWRAASNAEAVARVASEQFTFDSDRRLWIAPRKGETINGGHGGVFLYKLPHRSRTSARAFGASYTMTAPAGWRAEVVAWPENGNTGGVLGLQAWSLDSSTTLGSRSGSFTLDLGNYRWIEVIFAPISTTTYSGETGDVFFELREVRVRGTTGRVDTSTIARDVLAAASALNGGQVLPYTNEVWDCGHDLANEVYEDMSGSQVLRQLEVLGMADGRRIEMGVDERRMLYIRPHGSRARAWSVTEGEQLEALKIRRSVDKLGNSGYAVYQDAYGRTMRTDVRTDAASVARHGITRRFHIDSRTTSQIQAENDRNAALTDLATQRPSGAIPARWIKGTGNTVLPVYHARPGDTVTAANLDAQGSADIDRVRTFRLAEVRYNPITQVGELVPEEPEATLDVQQARRAEGYGADWREQAMNRLGRGRSW